MRVAGGAEEARGDEAPAGFGVLLCAFPVRVAEATPVCPLSERDSPAFAVDAAELLLLLFTNRRSRGS